MQRYLIGYLKDISNDELTKKYIDFFKFELDWFIYNYGEHVSKTHIRKPILPIRRKIIFEIQKTISLLSNLKISKNTINILSGVNFAKDVSFDGYNFNFYSSIFQPIGKSQIIGNKESLLIIKDIQKALDYDGQFTDIYNRKLFERMEDNQKIIIEQFKKLNLQALFLAHDQYYSSKYLIDIFKKIDKPSFVFSHGLPAIYSPEVDNKTDYLMVWGEKIRKNYIKAGFDESKIKVVGNTKYNNISISNNLRNSFDDILIMPTSSIVSHQYDWDETPTLIDRSMIILYLYQIKSVLEKFGVKKVRVRPHPSIKKEWVYGFLNKDFFEMDTIPFNESLRKSSLVIGATSTSFLEALASGVNYIIYEPLDEDKKGINRTLIVPPFDGSEPNLEIAKTADELEYLLKNKYISNEWDFNGYIQPLNLSVLKELIV